MSLFLSYSFLFISFIIGSIFSILAGELFLRVGCMNKILITGGAGFVGANLALHLRRGFPDAKIYALDNLTRNGSELNLTRLKNANINFVKGDVRNPDDLNQFSEPDVIIDAAAEPSVIAGLKGSPKSLVDINFGGTINCLELARKYQSTFIFLSTNRVYSYPELNNIEFEEKESRFEFAPDQPYFRKGISESFDILGLKSFYGASKITSEFFIQEYARHCGIKAIVNRFGVIAGPWQMGKVDQGFMTLWVAAHYFSQSLEYLGFGGSGKQVRDILHIDDVCQLIKHQLDNPINSEFSLYNVGGGWKNTTSLVELTEKVIEITGKTIPISANKLTRPVDIRIFYTNNTKVNNAYNWQPLKNTTEIVNDIFQWIRNNETLVAKIFTR